MHLCLDLWTTQEKFSKIEKAQFFYKVDSTNFYVYKSDFHTVLIYINALERLAVTCTCSFGTISQIGGDSNQTVFIDTHSYETLIHAFNQPTSSDVCVICSTSFQTGIAKIMKLVKNVRKLNGKPTNLWDSKPSQSESLQISWTNLFLKDTTTSLLVWGSKNRNKGKSHANSTFVP